MHSTNTVIMVLLHMQEPLTLINLHNNVYLIDIYHLCLCICLSGLSISVLPEGRHHEAGLASESQHQQQPVCLHEGESRLNLLSDIQAT